MNMPLILFWPFYIGSHNAIFSQFASKHKTSVTFFSSSFSDSWMLPKLVTFYSLHRTCTRSRQNLPCYADRMVGMHNAYLPTCRGLGVGTMFLFLNPLTYLCSGRPPLGEILAWKESLTLTCTYYEHETYTGSSLFWSIYGDFGHAAIDSPESVAENQKTMPLTFDLTLTMYVIFLRKI